MKIQACSGFWQRSQRWRARSRIRGRVTVSHWRPYRWRNSARIGISPLLPLEPQAVVGGVGQVLPGAQVALGGLDAGVAEQQLDLLQFPAPAAAELGAGSPEIVRPQPQAQLVPIKDRDGEDGLGRERVAGDLAVAVEGAQDPTFGNARLRRTTGRLPA